jgi:hypothetical protein
LAAENGSPSSISSAALAAGGGREEQAGRGLRDVGSCAAADPATGRRADAACPTELNAPVAPIAAACGNDDEDRNDVREDRAVDRVDALARVRLRCDALVDDGGSNVELHLITLSYRRDRTVA